MIDFTTLRWIQRFPTGLCEANGRECCQRAVGLFADDQGRGIQLCAAHQAQYVKTAAPVAPNSTPEGDSTR